MYTSKQLKEAVSVSECWSDVCRKLNVTVCTFNFKRAQKLCNENSISTSHFDVKKTFRRNKPHWSDIEVYTTKSLFPRHQLRRRIISDGFLKYCCQKCGNNGYWLKEKLTLEVEHKNGINDDHTKPNLEWLCPNCHSQTPTYRNNKNRKGPIA